MTSCVCINIGKLCAYLNLTEVDEHGGGETVDIRLSKDLELLRLLKRIVYHGCDQVAKL
jgi:hypothetical protein